MDHLLTCCQCQASFVSINRKARFCGRYCYHLSQLGRRRPEITVKRETRRCKTCGIEFTIGGSDGPTKRVCCSLQCAARIPRGRRRTKVTARIMTPTETAWLAGIVDGEGFICVTNKRFPTPTFILGVSNTCRPLLTRILEVTGCGRLDDSTRGVDRMNPYASRSWKWCAMTANALILLEQMLPWLIVKKSRAEKALAGERWEPGFGLSDGKKKQIEATFGPKVTP